MQVVFLAFVASQSAIPPSRTKSPPSAHDYLERAMGAKSPVERARWARSGLAFRGPIERTTQAMLLRQLYMAFYEAKKFRKAYEIAAQVLELRVLVDIAHQDAARACQALGQMDEAIGHLRLAARRGPPARRAFHLWTLGSALFLVERHREAAGCLERAAQWGTTEKALYSAHALLARLARGETVPNARLIVRRLSQTASAEGYGRFVLGMLAFHMKRWEQATTLLETFVERTLSGRPALGLSLAGELALARTTLARMSAN